MPGNKSVAQQFGDAIPAPQPSDVAAVRAQSSRSSATSPTPTSHTQVPHTQDEMELSVRGNQAEAERGAGNDEVKTRPAAGPRRFPFAFAKRHGLIVSNITQQGIVIQHIPGVSSQILAEAQRFLQCPTVYELVGKEDFEHLLARAYQSNSSETMQMVEGIGDDMDLASLAESVSETEDLLEQEDDAPIIRLINAILSEAIRENASDIHIESFEKRMVVRLRVDGVLREILQPRRELAPLLVSRIKVMAKMDIAEKRIPQDGRISLKVAGHEIDVRVSTMPSNSGERVVMRLLDKKAGRLDIRSLGMCEVDHRNTLDIIHKPHGIILVTGPTGSGKTTTLYAALAELNNETRNILTVEDPIEYQLEGIGQTQVNTKVDMTFARGLRAILRQDPDVVMVGEIRDRETAEIAVQASLTGHLVLSTLHTNTAAGAVTRLQDMGIEPFLLSTSLLGVLAQRLVRVLCAECRAPYAPSQGERSILDSAASGMMSGITLDELVLYRATGCKACNGSGYRGRTGIYELIVIDETIRNMIHDNSGELAIERYARTRSSGVRHDGVRKALEGVTTLEEVLRVTRED
ncbi:MAG: type II secretion system ATPase GspE [Gammaproteobacteria bacterium]